MRDPAPLAIGLLLLLSFAGATVEQTLSGASSQGQGTVIITRSGNALSGVMRLNGTDVPLANVAESDGFISFSTTFPVALASGSQTRMAPPGSDATSDLVAKSAGGPQALASLAKKPIVEPPLAIVEQPSHPEPTPFPPTEISSTLPVSVPAEPALRLAPLPQGQRYGLRNRDSRITLRVHRPTHVAVRGTRNRSFIDRPLAAGDTYRVPNLVGLRLSTPDAGAVEVILDGSSVGFMGEDGVTARGLSLNPQSIIDRQQRS